MTSMLAHGAITESLVCRTGDPHTAPNRSHANAIHNTHYQIAHSAFLQTTHQHLDLLFKWICQSICSDNLLNHYFQKLASYILVDSGSHFLNDGKPDVPVCGGFPNVTIGLRNICFCSQLSQRMFGKYWFLCCQTTSSTCEQQKQVGTWESLNENGET